MVIDRKILYYFSLGSFLSLWFCSCEKEKMGVDEKKRIVYSTIEDDMGFEKLPPSKPGEWLYHFREKGQTFEEYKAEVRNIKTEKRSTIYIQPLGTLSEMDKEILDKMREYATIFFFSSAMVNEPISIPEGSFNKNRWQFDANKILLKLEKIKPDDALAYVGVMSEDLYIEGLNFVFGLGSFDKCTGVYSLARYGDDYKIRLKRALKVMTHEMGHILSMNHCIFYRCIMCGSNSLPEADRRPMHLCPVCLEKLEWNIKFDRSERYRRLIDFYKQLGFEEEANFLSNLQSISE
ncbi:TPA: hypothetical protein DCX16_01755 [bacterium]|nr:hypothetical protein [bacterium]